MKYVTTTTRQFGLPKTEKPIPFKALRQPPDVGNNESKCCID